MISITGLHLQHRLWISEMNEDINVLRIFDDYVADIIANKVNAEVINRLDVFKKEFISLRKQIDALRHEMHLNKMELAEIAKEPKCPKQNIKRTIDFKVLKERYTAFKNEFNKTKKAFQKFCNETVI